MFSDTFKTRLIDAAIKLNRRELAVRILGPAAREDFMSLIDQSPDAARYLKRSLEAGMVSGENYQMCLLGNIAKGSNCPVEHVPGYHEHGPLLDAEIFCWMIKLGDTPATNPASRAIVEWIDAYLAASGRMTEPSEKSMHLVA